MAFNANPIVDSLTEIVAPVKPVKTRSKLEGGGYKKTDDGFLDEIHNNNNNERKK